MILKLIQIKLKPGCRESFLSCQHQWVLEMQKAQGYLGCFCAESRKSGLIYVWIGWDQESSYLEWMEARHDQIAAAVDAERYYLQAEVDLLLPAGGDVTFFRVPDTDSP